MVSLVNDHFLSPQTVGEFILDNPDPYLKNIELFLKVFECVSYTHEIRNTQNLSLAQLKHTVPTTKKYQHMNINLYNKKTSAPVSNILRPHSFVSDTFFDEYCQWEKEMVLNSDTEYGELLPDEKIYVQKSNYQPANLNEFFEDDDEDAVEDGGEDKDEEKNVNKDEDDDEDEEADEDDDEDAD